MVRADHLTPEEAKARLVKMQEQMRDRQREFAKRKREQGFKRINAFISPEAFEIIDRERKRTGDNTGDVLTAIIKSFGDSSKHRTKNVATNDVPRGTISATYELILKYQAEGMSYQQIADKLTGDGIPTATGKTVWKKGTVGNVIKRLKKEGN